MKRLQLLVLCVAVVIGVGAVSASVASASLPEYRFCVAAEPAKTGEYSDTACSEHAVPPGTGSHELVTWEHVAASKRTFKGKLGESLHTSYIPENESEPWTGGSPTFALDCKAGTSEGEITGLKTSIQTLTFTTCTVENKKCTSEGQKAGTIETNPLLGEIGYLEGGGVGLRLSAAEGGVIARYTCEGIAAVIGGSLIGVQTGNINKVSKESTIVWKAGKGGGQEIVFGSFPAGEGPFYLTDEQTPPGATLPECIVGTLVNKSREKLEVVA